MTNSKTESFTLVTGASSGIGSAIAKRLAKDGYKILLHYNKQKERAESILLELKEISPLDHQIIQFDISNSEQVESQLKSFEIQILINNAGIHKDNLMLLMSAENFEQVIQTNLLGSFYVSKVCAKKMLLKRNGIIVNMASLAGQTGNSGQANYAASKAGLIAMTKTLATELGPRGIRVNAVAPGLIDTEMIQNLPHLEEIKSRIPLKRIGMPEEVAGVVSFLCSADASYIQGHTISVNGGLFPS